LNVSVAPVSRAQLAVEGQVFTHTPQPAFDGEIALGNGCKCVSLDSLPLRSGRLLGGGRVAAFLDFMQGMGGRLAGLNLPPNLNLTANDLKPLGSTIA